VFDNIASVQKTRAPFLISPDQQTFLQFAWCWREIIPQNVLP
jgi:hypothetical protein